MLKRKSLLALVLASLALHPGVAAPEEIPSLDALRQDYEQALQKVQMESGVAAGKAGQYAKALAALADKLQKDGDLEGLLAAKKEKERFDKAKQVPEETPADLPPAVAKLQTDYRKSVSQSETDRNTAILTLTGKYVARLDALKKQLTMQGQIDEALKLKAEGERAKTSPVVASAEFALAELTTKPAPQPPSAATSDTTSDMVPCDKCEGTGHTAPPCPKCSNTGKCSSCDGRGMVPSPMKGTKGNLRCIPCKGSGQCRVCSGQEKQIACAACQGSGKVAAPVLPRRDAGPKSSPWAIASPSSKGTAVGKNTMGQVDTELDQYLEKMAGLHQLFKDGDFTPAAADKVIANPTPYTGKIIQSKVYLINGHPRGVRVAPSYEAIPKGGSLLIPYSRDVGVKAEEVFKAVGENGEVIVTYGIVSKENITLFDITRP